MEASKFKIAVPMLIVCLVASLSFNAYQFLNCDSENSEAKTFVYEWVYSDFVGDRRQKMLNGTLRLEITFKWLEQNLSIVAKINDDDRDDYLFIDMLGLVFDRSGNGVIDWGQEDRPYMLYASNYTYYDNTYLGYQGEGVIRSYWPLGPTPSSYHNCTFKEDVGYTFDITIPKSQLSDVKANMVYVYYQDGNIGFQPGWWVAVTFEEWQ